MKHAYQYLFAPVVLIGLIHILVGSVVLLAPGAARVSGLAGLALSGLPPLAITAILITVGALAITARMLPVKEWLSVTLIAPQQLVLLVQLFGIIIALRRGAYPDGYIPVPGDWQASFWFILADQAAWILLCLSHALDMLFFNALRLSQSQYEARLEQEHKALLDAKRTIALYEEGSKWTSLVDDMKLATTRDRETIDEP